MVEVPGTYWMWVELDAAQVDDPCEPSGIVDHDFFRGAARRECQRYSSQPFRTLAGRPLLIKCLAFCAVNESFQNQRTIADSAESALRNGEVIPDEVDLGEPGLLRKIKLMRMR